MQFASWIWGAIFMFGAVSFGLGTWYGVVRSRQMVEQAAQKLGPISLIGRR